MGNVDYRDKIKKLLALAESSNENEAKAALLKARELMAEHKLTEAECQEIKDRNVLEIETDVSFTRWSEPWMMYLASVISENYCCRGFTRKDYGKQIGKIVFIGLEEDVEICHMVFEYAVDCIRSECLRIKKRFKDYGSGFIKSEQNGYGQGFALGVEKSFEKQQEENEQEWGLVMLTPEEVNRAAKELNLKKAGRVKQQAMSKGAFESGMEDGKNFNPHSRIGGTRRAAAMLA